jgi:rod shape-determining protein MreD
MDGFLMARCVIAGVAVTYVLAVFQVTLGRRLAVGGVSPDLLFVWTVCLGLVSGARVGSLVGFGAGLLEGSLKQTFVAALGISKGICGFLAGLLATKMFRENWIVPALTGAVLTPVNDLIFVLLSGGSWPLSAKLLVGRTVYHALLTPLVLALVLRARGALVGRELEVG